MRRDTSASALAESSADTARCPRVSRASNGSPSAQVTSHAASSKALPVPWPNETPECLRRSLCATTSSTSVMPLNAARRSRDEPLEGAAVNVFQHVEACQVDALVDLVDARIDRAELDHFAAQALDEAAIGRATRRRK